MGCDGLGQMCAFTSGAQEEQYVGTRPTSAGSEHAQMGRDLSVMPKRGGRALITVNLQEEPAFQKLVFEIGTFPEANR
ncbi:MAG: hypothetical protein DRJ14_09320 [Acidobacteria bacterium]|nr:MAG: hypothetical protein DRJ14_09320 [Acidobacteriota bacterium]